MMKYIRLLLVLGVLLSYDQLLAQDAPRLIVRGDDIGSTHAANLACIKAYQDGIMQSVEIMVPCAWFPEAVRLLKENPALDVGVHLTLTSEWENVKWGPVSHAPSLSDGDGYFFPMIWANERFPEERTLRGTGWKLEEVEAELRAQIEMALKHLPQVTHLSAHMGCTSMDERVRKIHEKLAREYGLDIDPGHFGVESFPVRVKGETLEERTAAFIDGLGKLAAGKTYLFVEHPALAGMEMEAVGHDGYYTVSTDRQLVTELFTSPFVKEAIRNLGIELISYADLVK